MRILITGGHITPALAIIEELKKYENIEFVFVGRKHALDFEKTLSFEYQSIKKLGIKFIELKAGRLTRIISLRSLVNFLKFPCGFFRSFKILKQEKPDTILSFGGYLALPIAVAGWLFKIPIYTHEQTLIPGLTNRLISFFARKIFISFPQTKKYFTAEKVIFSGNPLRTSIFQIKKKAFKLLKNKKKVIYITGGSLGAHSLNVLIESILDKLLKQFIVIHQTGDVKEYGDFEKLSKMEKQDYFVQKHFFDSEIGFIYSIADLVISRSGANTIFELIALKKPAILIPLPWSAGGEQKAQAMFLKDKGVVEIFFQDNARDDLSDRLYTLIIKMSENLQLYQRNFSRFKNYYQKDAVQKIVACILAQD